MKKIYKFTSSILIPTFALVPISCLSSCNNNFSDTIYQQTLTEFGQINKIYRPTFGTRQIWAYIKEQIANIKDDQGYPTFDDDFWHMQERESEWEIPGSHKNGNIKIVVPAYSGCENWPVVGLQAHMDMVCDNLSGGAITTVIDGDKLHSKNWQTSIGADDGIGVATILTIIRNRNNFKHGKLVCFITTDEEDGESGACWILNDWLDGIEYFINLDHEDSQSIGASCAGFQQTSINFDCNTVSLAEETYSSYKNFYRLKISNANGGTSGFALQNNPVFAIQLAFNILSNIFLTATSTNPIIITNMYSDTLDVTGTGSLSKNMTIEFATNSSSTYQDLNDASRKIFLNILATHSNEINLMYTFESFTPTLLYGISPEDSTKIINLFNDKGFYGCIDDDSINKPFSEIVTCSNLQPITLNFNFETNLINLSFKTFARTFSSKVLGPKPSKTTIIEKYEGMVAYYRDLVLKYFNEDSRFDTSKTGANGWICPNEWNPSWEINKNNKALDLYMSYAKKTGTNLYDFHALAWCETAQFANKNPNMKIFNVGPTIYNPHLRDGYVLLSSIKSMIERLLYTLTNLTEEKTN